MIGRFTQGGRLAQVGILKPTQAALAGALILVAAVAGRVSTAPPGLAVWLVIGSLCLTGLPVIWGAVRGLAKLETNAGDRMVYKLDIKGDGSSILCGVGLPDGIEKFNEKLGTMGQSHLLPYMVLIENGEANILHAKFFLALSFPQLTMTEFMKIMSVPGDIEKAFKADFK